MRTSTRFVSGHADDQRFQVDLSSDSVGSFGDIRIDNLGALVLNRMSKMKVVCLRRLAGGNKSLYQAFWRLFKNRKFSVDELIRHAGQKTAERCSRSKHVLLLQDTCEVAFDDLENPQREGLSPLNQTACGILLHPALAVDAESRACLGILSAHMWTRPKKSKRKKKGRSLIEERESLRWINVAQAARSQLPKETIVTVIGDRDSDIYEEYDRVPDETTHLVTRMQHDRMLVDGSKLFATLESFPLRKRYELFLPAITGKRAARTAVIELRFSKVEIKKAKNCKDKLASASISLNTVEAREVGLLPKNQEKTRLLWRLLTTHTVETLEDAL